MRFGFSKPRPIEFLLDAPEDVCFAHTGTPQLVHVFYVGHQGMRSAACYAPGHKLSLLSLQPPRRESLAALTEQLRALGVTRALFHATSASSDAVARHLAREGLTCVGVWHGSSAQLCLEEERQWLRAFVNLRREGVFASISSVKPGWSLAEPLFLPSALLNFPPHIEPGVHATTSFGTVLIPIEVVWRKNFHTNVFAAAAVELVREIHLCNDHDTQPALGPQVKIVQHGTCSRDEMFRLMRQSQVVMNASLTDCQPMIWLEALAVGVPCLVPALGLAPFDAHPYMQLVTVHGADLISHVADALRRVLTYDAHTLGALIAEFRNQWVTAARERFVQITQATD